jgi:LPXTG-motif cell wall-anchored protein
MDMMRLAQTSRKKYGNTFTYTLIDERDTLKFRNTTLSLIVGIGLLALSGYLFTKKR